MRMRLAMLVAFLSGCALAGRAAESEFPDDCWGVYSWCSWNPKTITRERCPDLVGAPIIMHWKSLEPAEGDYRFDQLLGERLRLAKENGFRVFTMIWVGPHAPAWIYDRGVPHEGVWGQLIELLPVLEAVVGPLDMGPDVGMKLHRELVDIAGLQSPRRDNFEAPLLALRVEVVCQVMDFLHLHLRQCPTLIVLTS